MKTQVYSKERGAKERETNMDYKVTRNGQQTGKWFATAGAAWDWILAQRQIETTMGFPRLSVYVAYYNPTGHAVNEWGERQN